MRYKLSTASTGDAVAFSDVIKHCRVVDDSDLDYLHGLLDKAALWVQQRLQRQLLTATWILYLDCFPAEIELNKLPVASVTSITYVDTAGDTQTLGTSYYQTDFASPDKPGRIMPAYGYSWPSTRSDTYDAIAVTFTAGYGTAASVPKTIQQALLMLVNHWYDFREPAITGAAIVSVPYMIDDLIAGDEWGAYN